MPGKPSDKEERFFSEQELLIRLQIIAEEQRTMAEVEKRRLKELHWMHWPRRRMARWTFAPGCKGLWLDANELDTILASTQQSGPWRSFLKILGR